MFFAEMYVIQPQDAPILCQSDYRTFMAFQYVSYARSYSSSCKYAIQEFTRWVFVDFMRNEFF